MEVSILYRDHIQNSREWYKASPEDELDEAVALRNQAVCDTLDITLRFEIVRPITNNYETYLHNTIINDILPDFIITIFQTFKATTPLLRTFAIALQIFLTKTSSLILIFLFLAGISPLLKTQL